MATLPPRTVELEHRARHLRVAPGQSLCVAASSEGATTLVDIESGRARPIAGLPRIRDLCPHPTRSLLAVIDDATGALSIVDFDGSRLLGQKAPRPRKALGTWLRPGFQDCFFDRDGDHLWTVVRLADDTVEVRLLETERWSVVGSATVEDPFEEGQCSFHATGRPDGVALWLSAGQNGQRGYWVTRLPDSLGVEPEPFLEDATPPVFSPRGDEFLVIDGLWAVCRYPFPADRKLGTCRSKWGKKDYFGECLSYLDEATALVQTHHGRLFRIDLRTMKIRGEFAVPGHEPRPADEYYPGLVGGPASCTDLAYFTGVGEHVVFVYDRNTGDDLRKWKGTLIFHDAASIAGTAARGGRA